MNTIVIISSFMLEFKSYINQVSHLKHELNLVFPSVFSLYPMKRSDTVDVQAFSGSTERAPTIICKNCETQLLIMLILSFRFYPKSMLKIVVSLKVP